MSKNGTLPHWDLTAVYPSLESDEFNAGFNALLSQIDDLTAYFDAHGIDRVETAVIDADTVATFETVIERFNVLLDDAYTLHAFINGHITTDSRNAVAQAKYSKM